MSPCLSFRKRACCTRVLSGRTEGESESIRVIPRFGLQKMPHETCMSLSNIKTPSFDLIQNINIVWLERSSLEVHLSCLLQVVPFFLLRFLFIVCQLQEKCIVAQCVDMRSVQR
mmetsp:Transcript_26655/g.65692  ORF Transcript_26655/g.65692 Transcript_26655/m.65692 type:complete len:114 (+) Transcript_26655:1088-1429(+)